MGAAGSISDEDISESIEVSKFCDEKLASIRYIPPKSECYDATFQQAQEENSPGDLVPQKYMWLQGVCAAFVMFTDMRGKTLPELWDSYAGSGYTDHSTATMLGQAKQVMMETLSPIIKGLINKGIKEQLDQEAWAIAIGKVEYSNLCQAHEKNPDVDIMYALTGRPDKAFPVSESKWKDYVFKTDLFSRKGKWNGSAYSKTQLERIVGKKIDTADIDYP